MNSMAGTNSKSHHRIWHGGNGCHHLLGHRHLENTPDEDCFDEISELANHITSTDDTTLLDEFNPMSESYVNGRKMQQEATQVGWGRNGFDGGYYDQTFASNKDEIIVPSAANPNALLSDVRPPFNAELRGFQDFSYLNTSFSSCLPPRRQDQMITNMTNTGLQNSGMKRSNTCSPSMATIFDSKADASCSSSSGGGKIKRRRCSNLERIAMSNLISDPTVLRPAAVPFKIDSDNVSVVDVHVNLGTSFAKSPKLGKQLNKATIVPVDLSPNHNSPVGTATEQSEATKWKQMFLELVKFHNKYGHCLVPCEGGDCSQHTLGQWIKNQRHQYSLFSNMGPNYTTMNSQRIALLESLDGFKWDSHSVHWEEMFLQLKAYAKIHGHCNADSSSSRESKKRFGPLCSWIRCQRRQRRLREKNQNSTITEDRIRRLDSIGFDWK